MAGEWYTYTISSTFGKIDSEGNYWQPDVNFLAPWGSDVTALLPGTVTSVQRTSYGQTVITIKLDTPVNSLATHEFYEHLHDATVSQGTHVNDGDLIGHINYSGEGAPLGFGLYPGDVYGSGPGWNVLQSDLAPGGAGLLNPLSLIQSAKGGTLNTGSNGGGVSTSNNDFLTSTGTWIVDNLFHIDPTLVSGVETVSPLPLQIIGGVSLALVAITVITVFIVLVGV
jgi:murein DD-endopeptidase MepM/ murein hydrolase activator NlpD